MLAMVHGRLHPEVSPRPCPNAAAGRRKGVERESHMRRYIALIRQEHGSFSVEFPDLPGCVSAGETLDEAINRASIALSFYAADTIGSGLSLPAPTPSDAILEATEARGATAVLVALYPPKGQQARAHISADEHFLRRIDAAAAERGIKRSAFLMARSEEHTSELQSLMRTST